MDDYLPEAPPAPSRFRFRVRLVLIGALLATALWHGVRGAVPVSSPGRLPPLGTAAEQARWSCYNGLAYAAYERGDFAEAVTQQRQSALAALRAPGSGHPDITWTIFNLGRCYFGLADRDPTVLPLAVRDFDQSARMFAASGLESEAMNSRVWQGQALLRLDQAEAARAVLALAWAQIKASPALRGDPRQADPAGGSLTEALCKLKRWDEANAVAEERFQLAERTARPGQPATPALCSLWEERAEARINRGIWAEAAALATRAVEARRGWLAAIPPANPATGPAKEARAALAQAQWLLGRALEGVGEYAAAERPLRESLFNRCDALGAQHAKVAESAVTLMNTYVYLGRYTEARPLAEQALAIEARLYPRADDPRRAATYHLAADVFDRTGAAGRAGPLYQQAVALLLARPGQPEDHELTSACDALGVFLYGQSRRPEAIAVYRKELEIERRLGCEDDRDRNNLSSTYNNLGRALLEENRLPEADAALSEALRVTDTIAGGRAHPDATAVLSNLALVRAEEGRYAESETLFKEALDGRVRAFGSRHPKVGYTLRGIARLYQLTGRGALAQEASARAEAILAAAR